MRRRVLAFIAVCAISHSQTPTLSYSQQAGAGYYRQPSVRANTIVFVSEGDLWKVDAGGGAAMRLTTNLAEESQPQISPDGRTIAFTGRYDGVADVYTIPVTGGAPRRHSWEGNALVVGWNGERILYSTNRYSTLPNWQLVSVDPKTNARDVVPLAQGWDGSYAGDVLYFTRFSPAARSTRLYTGGTAQNIWRFARAGEEAVCLTCDWKGTSRSAQVSGGRVYFLSDRADKTLNVWSMDLAGKDLKQHTSYKAKDYEVRDFSVDNGVIVYQQGADLHRLAAGATSPIGITLPSDQEQLRDRFIKNPMSWLSDFHIDKTGERVSLVARGAAFIAPVGQGRFIQLPDANGRVRYRVARFFGDGTSVVTLNDRSGEVELWRQPVNGTGAGVQLTKDATILRWDAEPSPDGRLIAHDDKDQKLYVYDTVTQKNKQIASSKYDGFSYWWGDSRTLLYQASAPNGNGVIYRYDAVADKSTALTSDRFNNFSPAVTPDGAWLYFLSDRNFVTSVGSPWGLGAPDPYFNSQTKIYAVQLKRGPRFAFAPRTELDVDTVDVRAGECGSVGVCELFEVPVPAGNYGSLATDGKRLYLTARTDRYSGAGAKVSTIEFVREDAKLETFVDGVGGFELSGDAKKILFRKGNSLYVVPAGAKAPNDLSKHEVDLSGWMLQLERREELKNLFVDAWRLQRDYFYDPGMHGLDWKAIRSKYEPLAARVHDRSELNDVVSQMVAELSALHVSVVGGDLRAGLDTIAHGALGAVLVPVTGAGAGAGAGAADGWRVERIYRPDPELIGELSPLARAGVQVSEGDVIVAINGVSLGSVAHPAELLLGKAGKQVLIELQGGKRFITEPMTLNEERNLRYSDWEYSRKQLVDRLSNGRIAYVHVRTMGAGDMAQFQRDFFHQYDKEALVVDVRNNGGGNIESWLLAKLMKKPWMWWQPRVGEPYRNMQFAFNGPMATMVNEYSGSDGEIFPEGFRRLGLGKVYGTRTWGGEIWLTGSNALADRGIATAPEFGVYGPEGAWLIEQHGVDPDVVVDNLPASAYRGEDAQLERTVRGLLEELGRKPAGVPKAPAYPKK